MAEISPTRKQMAALLPPNQRFWFHTAQSPKAHTLSDTRLWLSESPRLCLSVVALTP